MYSIQIGRATCPPVWLRPSDFGWSNPSQATPTSEGM